MDTNYTKWQRFDVVLHFTFTVGFSTVNITQQVACSDLASMVFQPSVLCSVDFMFYKKDCGFMGTHLLLLLMLFLLTSVQISLLKKDILFSSFTYALGYINNNHLLY